MTVVFTACFLYAIIIGHLQATFDPENHKNKWTLSFKFMRELLVSEVVGAYLGILFGMLLMVINHYEYKLKRELTSSKKSLEIQLAYDLHQRGQDESYQPLSEDDEE